VQRPLAEPTHRVCVTALPVLVNAVKEDDDKDVVHSALNGIGAIGKKVGPAAIEPRTW